MRNKVYVVKIKERIIREGKMIICAKNSEEASSFFKEMYENSDIEIEEVEHQIEAVTEREIKCSDKDYLPNIARKENLDYYIIED